jgi:hypothetical protein
MTDNAVIPHSGYDLTANNIIYINTPSIIVHGAFFKNSFFILFIFFIVINLLGIKQGRVGFYPPLARIEVKRPF